MTTTLPVVAQRDEAAIRRLGRQLPHALLIVAEAGLHGAAVADFLARQQSAERLTLCAQDKAATITTELARSLIAALRTTSQGRVVIIPRAEQLSEPAQNVLLKAIEEPSLHTHFILVAPHAEALLSTVRSRCQTLALHRTSPAQDEQLLVAQRLDTTTQRQLRFLAAGRPQLLEQLATTPELRRHYSALASDAKRIIAAPQSYQALCCLQSYANDRAAALQLLECLLDMLRFRARTTPLTQRDTQLFHAVSEAITAIRANGNTRLALLALVV